jgi:hypothetical protein
MTAEVRADLAASLARGGASPSCWRMACWPAIGIVVVVVEFRVFGGGLGWLVPFAARLPNWCAPLVGAIPPAVIYGGPILWLVAAGAFVRGWRKIRAKKKFQQTCAPQIREALEDGRAVVCRIGAVGVIVVEQSQDELGSILIYDLGDGRSFLMWSHDFYYSDNRNFTAELPQTFEIVRTAAQGLWLGLANCEGQLEAELKIWDEETPEESLDPSKLPGSESVVPGCPREVLARWGYQEDE